MNERRCLPFLPVIILHEVPLTSVRKGKNIELKKPRKAAYQAESESWYLQFVSWHSMN